MTGSKKNLRSWLVYDFTKKSLTFFLTCQTLYFPQSLKMNFEWISCMKMLELDQHKYFPFEHRMFGLCVDTLWWKICKSVRFTMVMSEVEILKWSEIKITWLVFLYSYTLYLLGTHLGSLQDFPSSWQVEKMTEKFYVARREPKKGIGIINTVIRSMHSIQRYVHCVVWPT